MTERVIIDRSKFDNRGEFVYSEEVVEVPELNRAFGLNEGEVACIKVRQLSLSEFLTARGESVNYARNLIDGVLSAAQSARDVEDEVLRLYRSMSPDAQLRIDACTVGVVEPKLNRSDVVWLSKYFPGAVTKIYNKILALTDKGGDLKKNLNDLSLTTN